MSNFTDDAENLIADWMRGQGLASLPASFYIGLASAAADGSLTELAGTGYARQPLARSLANWASTQGSGTVLASTTGTSHQTSNNVAVSFGTSGSAWGTANFITIHTAVTGGSMLSFHPIAARVIGNGAAVSLAAGDIVCTVGAAGGTSDYLANKFIDLWFRAQAFTFPANAYFALFTTAPTNAGGGVEVNGPSYSRVSTPFSLAGFSNTAAAATTTVAVGSGGTGGVISNNLAVAFPTPLESWAAAAAEGVFDSLTAGNLLFWNLLDGRLISAGSSPQTHAAGWITPCRAIPYTISQ